MVIWPFISILHVYVGQHFFRTPTPYIC